MHLILVTIILTLCVGLGYGFPQSLEGSQASFKINGSCSTPAGKPGRCISIHSCPEISNKLQHPPISEETIALVKKSICKSPVERSVCCDISIVEERVYTHSCQAEMTASPPDPSSACCGKDTVPDSKLASVGGMATPIDAHPWAVIIEYIRHKDGMTRLYCGGSIISGKYVLTAAHCIAGSVLMIAKPTVVRLGEYDLSQDGKDCVVEFRGDPPDCTDGALRIAIEKTIPHPEYTPKISKKNDIGLIRLQETAPYTDFIRPICLPTKDLTRPENMPVNLTMFAVGWGATETSFQSNLKLEVEVPFVSQEKCQPVYNTTGRRATLGRGQLCAGGVKAVDTCRGDSGGPLVYQDRDRSQVIGIVSFGPNPCGEKDVPGIYTNVYEYLDWIRSVIVS